MKTSYFKSEMKEQRQDIEKIGAIKKKISVIQIESSRVISSIKRTLCDHQKGVIRGIFKTFNLSSSPGNAAESVLISPSKALLHLAGRFEQVFLLYFK